MVTFALEAHSLVFTHPYSFIDLNIGFVDSIFFCRFLLHIKGKNVEIISIKYNFVWSSASARRQDTLAMTAPPV